MRREIIVLLIVISVFFAAGCAENGNSGEPAPSTPVEEVNNGGVAGTEGNITGAGSEIVDVEIRDYKYTPQNVTIKVGQTVRWTNYDNVPHDVVGSGIESEHLQKGGVFTYTFEKEGTYQYICTIHPWMKGEVIVEA